MLREKVLDEGHLYREDMPKDKTLHDMAPDLDFNIVDTFYTE